MLIDSSDKKTSDKSKLHVTIKHNTFENTVQRTPQVRYGHVDIENNLYKVSSKSPYRFSYAYGYGKNAHIKADHNYFAGKGTKQIAKHLVAGNQGASLISKNNIINGRAYNIILLGKRLTRSSKHSNLKAPEDESANGATSISHHKSKKALNKYLKSHHTIDGRMKWLAKSANI